MKISFCEFFCGEGAFPYCAAHCCEQCENEPPVEVEDSEESTLKEDK